jgi:hypothetical protein
MGRWALGLPQAYRPAFWPWLPAIHRGYQLSKSALGVENLNRFGWKQPNTFISTGMRAKAMGADRSRFDNQLTAINNCEPQQDVRSLNNLSIAAHSSLFTWRVAFPKIFYPPVVLGHDFSRRWQRSVKARPHMHAYLIGLGLFFATAVFVL